MKTLKIVFALLSFIVSARAFAGSDVVLVWTGTGYQVVASGENTYYMDRFYFCGGPWAGVVTYYHARPEPEWFHIGTYGDPTYWWDIVYPSEPPPAPPPAETPPPTTPTPPPTEPPPTPPIGSDDTPPTDPTEP